MGKYRKTFFRTNKYQRQIILLAFCPVLIIFSLVSVLITLMHNDMAGVILYNSPSMTAQFISNWANLINSSVCMALVIVLLIAYVMSSRLVGAMERVITELDEVIQKNDKKMIKVRKGDDLASDILTRVNVIIERLP